MQGNIGNFVAPPADMDSYINVALPAPAGLVDIQNTEGEESTYRYNDKKETDSDRTSQKYDMLRAVSTTISSEKISNHGGSGRLANVFILVVISATTFNAKWDDLVLKNDDEYFAKFLGAASSVGSSVTAILEGAQKVGWVSFATDTNVFWKITGKGVGLIGAGASLLDAASKFGESLDATKKGHTTSSTYSLAMSGASLVNGLVTIAAVMMAGAVVGMAIGVALGILTLYIAYQFISIVAPSVQAWVDRSIIGRHISQVLPFDDIESEQSSLEMVFNGVVVELLVKKKDIDKSNYVVGLAGVDFNSYSIDVEDADYEINLLYSAPKVAGSTVDIKVIGIEKAVTLHDVNAKYGDVEISNMGNSDNISMEVSDVQGNDFVVSSDKLTLNKVFVVDKSDMLTGISVDITAYTSNDGMRLSDKFVLGGI
ncbi:hypothetical protein ACU8V3_13300 [Cobetia marina]